MCNNGYSLYRLEDDKGIYKDGGTFVALEAKTVQYDVVVDCQDFKLEGSRISHEKDSKYFFLRQY